MSITIPVKKRNLCKHIGIFLVTSRTTVSYTLSEFPYLNGKRPYTINFVPTFHLKSAPVLTIYCIVYICLYWNRELKCGLWNHIRVFSLPQSCCKNLTFTTNMFVLSQPLRFNFNFYDYSFRNEERKTHIHI